MFRLELGLEDYDIIVSRMRPDGRIVYKPLWHNSSSGDPRRLFWMLSDSCQSTCVGIKFSLSFTQYMWINANPITSK